MPEASSGRSGQRGRDRENENENESSSGLLGGGNAAPEVEDTYLFSFDANWAVTQMIKIDEGVQKVKDLTGSTFTVETGLNDLQQTDAVEVTRTRTKRGVEETTVYSDQDGDDVYTQVLEVEIYGADARPNKIEQYQFTFDANDNVTGYSRLKKGEWVVKNIDANESFETITVGTDVFVAKTEVDGTEVEIEFFQDVDGDNIWLEVAEAEMTTSSPYYDAVLGEVTPDFTIWLAGAVAM
jgi:hypothetical protein